MSATTQLVRIAVAIDAEGNFCASGGGEEEAETSFVRELPGLALRLLLDRGRGAPAGASGHPSRHIRAVGQGVPMSPATLRDRDRLDWRTNAAGKWAWFDGGRQVSGAYSDGACRDYAFEVHGLTQPGEALATEVTIASHPEFPRLVGRYGRLSLAEMDALAEVFQADARAALSQHVREFNGNGGRRYGAAMSVQAGRELAEERLLLCAYRDFRAYAAGEAGR